MKFYHKLKALRCYGQRRGEKTRNETKERERGGTVTNTTVRNPEVRFHGEGE